MGKVCQGQTLWLITKARKIWTKKFYNIGPRARIHKTILRQFLK
jgi:hypothetical protein